MEKCWKMLNKLIIVILLILHCVARIVKYMKYLIVLPKFCLPLYGASLSEPHIDHDNSPRTWNNGMYLCIIYPAFVAPWFPRSVYGLKFSVYSGILTCSRAWFTTLCTRLWTNSKNDWSYSLLMSQTLLWRLLMKTGRWMRMQTHGIKRIQPTGKVEL